MKRLGLDFWILKEFIVHSIDALASIKTVHKGISNIWSPHCVYYFGYLIWSPIEHMLSIGAT